MVIQRDVRFPEFMNNKIYDVAIVGGGHNGLTTACYLAKAGLKVIVVEKHEYVEELQLVESYILDGLTQIVHMFVVCSDQKYLEI